MLRTKSLSNNAFLPIKKKSSSDQIINNTQKNNNLETIKAYQFTRKVKKIVVTLI
jgi:hypothetical protein